MRLSAGRLTLLYVLAAGAVSCGRVSKPAATDDTAEADTGPALVPGAGSAAAPDSVSAVHPESTISPAAASLAPPNPSFESAAEADLDMLRSELIIPVSGVIAGELRDTFTESRGAGRLHDAIDIPAPRGTPVLSASPGRVLKLFTSKAGGLIVYAADSSERFILMYAHLDSYAPGLIDGSRVARGQTLGFVGTTGNAPPNVPHLHFAIARSTEISKWWQGVAVNPFPILRRR